MRKPRLARVLDSVVIPNRAQRCWRYLTVRPIALDPRPPRSAMTSTEPTASAPTPKTAKEIEDRLAMPPPPAPSKKVILEPELNGLKDALKACRTLTGKFASVANTIPERCSSDRSAV